MSIQQNMDCDASGQSSARNILTRRFNESSGADLIGSSYDSSVRMPQTQAKDESRHIKLVQNLTQKDLKPLLKPTSGPQTVICANIGETVPLKTKLVEPPKVQGKI